MNRHHALAWAAFSVSAVVSIAPASAQHAAGQMSDQDLIKSAMSAAPPAVAEHATIVAVSADGTMKVLRKGDNGFTCLPDSPNTPGPIRCARTRTPWSG